MTREEYKAKLKKDCEDDGLTVRQYAYISSLESENAKLKRLLAEAHLDMHALKSVLGVKR